MNTSFCTNRRKSMTIDEAVETLKAEYEEACNWEYVVDPVAYASHETWKKAHARRKQEWEVK